MYVTRLQLTDIRCFKELDIKFGRPGESILLIGDNGDGKSTVLRSLAMGMCDQSSASALFRELHGEHVRHNSTKDQGTIVVELADGNRQRYRIKTIVRSLETFERVEQHLYSFHGRQQKLNQDTFPWDRIFGSGYGAGIRVHGTADVEAYQLVDAVYPLFRYDAPLQNPELVVRRLVDDALKKKRGQQESKKVLDEIKNLLKEILQLHANDRVILTATGLAIKAEWGKEDLRALGDGYRATVTLVLDLLSWWFIRWQGSQKRFDLSAVRGIVLIDEVEQHLHPRWQRNIMRLLTESFPNVQFIATTHSPLVASGCEGIPVHQLAQGDHKVVSPFGWLAEDVYEMMGLQSSRARMFVENVLDEYARLDAKRLRSALSRGEQQRLTELRKKLQRLPGDDPIRLTTELANLAKEAKKLAGSQT